MTSTLVLKYLSKNLNMTDKFGGPVQVVTNGRNLVSFVSHNGAKRIKLNWNSSVDKWEVVQTNGFTFPAKMVPDNEMVNAVQKLFLEASK